MSKLSQGEMDNVIYYLLRSGRDKLQKELVKLDFCVNDILNITWEIELKGIVRDPETMDLTVNDVPVSLLIAEDMARETMTRALSRIVPRGN